MKPKKAKPTRIRPYEGDREIAQIISEKTGLEIIDVMSLALSAGLKAIRDNQYRVKLPLKLKIDESSGSGDFSPRDRDRGEHCFPVGDGSAVSNQRAQ